MNRRSVLLLLFAFLILVVDAYAQNLKVITGATLIDVATGKSIPNAVVLIDGPRIIDAGPAATTTIPAGAMRIDAAGKFVIPGLADMHNHLVTGTLSRSQNLKANLARMLAVGVTTIFDPSISKADFATLKSTEKDSNPYPHFFGTGPIVTVEGDVLGSGVDSEKPTTAAEAQAVVKRLKAAGVDAIKMQLDDLSWASTFHLPLMKPEVMTALIKEAHVQELRVYVHAPQLDQAKDALRAGVDGLMHGILDKPVDAEFVDLMKRNHAVYIPTLGLYEEVADVANWVRRESSFDQNKLFPAADYDALSSPAAVAQFATIFDGRFAKEHLPTARANVKKAFDAGIPIVLGTDTGFLGMILGASTPLELTLLVEAGLKPADALRSATLEAARMIGREKDMGVVEKDHLADLLILNSNPLDDIRNVQQIYRVVLGGTVIDPSTR